jgi:hypothetical protein
VEDLERYIPDHIRNAKAQPGWYVRATDATCSLLVAGPYARAKDAIANVDTEYARCVARERRCAHAYWVIQKV